MDEKLAYVEKAHARLHEWQGWIARFRSSLSRADARQSPAAQRLNRRLDDQLQAARLRFEDLQRAAQVDEQSPDAHDLSAGCDQEWEAAKDGLERAMIDLKRAIDESGAARQAPGLALRAHRDGIVPFSCDVLPRKR